MSAGVSIGNRHRRARPCTPEHSRRVSYVFHGSVMHCAHFSFDLLGPHKGFLNLTERAHVHEFLKTLLTEFTVYLKTQNVHWVAPQIVLLIIEQSVYMTSFL